MGATTFKCPHCGERIFASAYKNRVTGPAPTFDHDQALSLLKFGATTKEVAETFGVSRSRIHQIRQRAGV